MGCASSAPLVDAAKQKASEAAAEAEKIKDDAVDKMKETAESAKEQIIELKGEVEEKVASLVGSGKSAAEEAAERAKQEAEKAVQEVESVTNEALQDIEDTKASSIKEMEEKTEEAKKEVEEMVEAAKEEESTKADSRASTAAPHTPDIWTRPETSGTTPPSELTDLRDRIDEDIKGMEENCRLEEIKAAQESLRDKQEKAEEAAEEKFSKINDDELSEATRMEEELIEGKNFEIPVGSEAENAHGASEPSEDKPTIEENNNINKGRKTPAESMSPDIHKIS